jgi:hypothetical protein
MKSRQIKIALISLLLVVLNFGSVGHAKGTRIINWHGTQIPSIFYGLSPNPKITPEYFRAMKTNSRNARPCPLLKTAVYRESDGLARLLQVQGGCCCHFQLEITRPCVSCLGGDEQWTYSDSDLATYCDGYTFDVGCVGNCVDHVWCYNIDSPGCF